MASFEHVRHALFDGHQGQQVGIAKNESCEQRGNCLLPMGNCLEWQTFVKVHPFDGNILGY